ncbi:unnamed protein product [Alopecurus aequalis]
MQFAVAATKGLLSKLAKLLQEEYKLQAGVKENVESLGRELTSMHTALGKVADVPPDDLDSQVKLWARDVRELSCDIENIVDTFMVRVEGLEPADLGCFMGAVRKLTKLCRNLMTRHKLGNAIKDIKAKADTVNELRVKYKVDLAVDDAKRWDDPRLAALCVDMPEQLDELVGLKEARVDLVKRLAVEGDVKQLKIVSIAGFGGSGKTTLARLAHEDIRHKFHCWAFVSLCRNREKKKVLKDILRQLDKPKYQDINEEAWEQSTLVNEIKDFLRKKRYYIVIDDIWDIESWKTIHLAMVDNHLGSRIITTTRNFDVAQEIGGVYKLKPLSPVNSRRLFYRRLFGGDRQSRDNQLVEIPDAIVESCGGIPLVINTVAGLLDHQPTNIKRDQWDVVYNSIWSGGHEDNPDVKKMRTVLSFSYYDLPSHLRACLLHASIFTNDHAVIRRDRLVWRWITEGLIQGKQGTNSLFELGEKYIKELLNSGMMEEEEVSMDDGMVKFCRVKSLVLDLMLFLASKEKTFSPGKVHGLSLPQNGNAERSTSPAASSKHVRSVTVFGPDGVKLMPPIKSFKVLSVMDLEGCDFGMNISDLRHIGKLLHLRYLGLRGTNITQLPKEIGDLLFMQVLDLARTKIIELPSSIVQLRRLMCLYVDPKTRLPAKGMDCLTSLEELSKISCCAGESPSENFVKEELVKLLALRTLQIVLSGDNESLEKDLLKSLGKLQKVQILRVHARGGTGLDLMRQGWAPPPDLRSFLAVDCWFSKLPTWINKPRLVLSELHIGVRELRQEDLKSLGRLMSLESLRLAMERTSGGRGLEVAGADAFPSLTEFRFRSETYSALLFQPGAMPKVKIFALLLNVDHQENGDLDWGLGNLPSLEEVYVGITCDDARRREEMEAGLRHGAESHPNFPTFQLTSEKNQLANTISASVDSATTSQS